MSDPRVSWGRFLIVAVLLAATAAFLRSRAQAENLPPRQALASFPSRISEWRGREVVIPQAIRDVLGAGEFLQRSYIRSPEEPSIDLFLAYFPTQRTDNTIHSPQNCLPGSGWTPVGLARIELNNLPNSPPATVNRYVLAKGLDRLVVLYWYQSHGRIVASEYWAKLYLVVDAIKLNRSDGALVRVTTALREGERLDAADQRAVEFVRQVFPQLDRFLPR